MLVSDYFYSFDAKENEILAEKHGKRIFFGIFFVFLDSFLDFVVVIQ